MREREREREKERDRGRDGEGRDLMEMTEHKLTYFIFSLSRGVMYVPLLDICGNLPSSCNRTLCPLRKKS